MNWIESSIKFIGRFSDIEHDGNYFRLQRRAYWEGENPPYKHMGYELYLPVADDFNDVMFRAWDFIHVCSKAHEEAQLLSKTIIDESIPVSMDLIEADYWNFFGGGRRAAVNILGFIKYYPAISNLTEAMNHDSDSSMRVAATRSLGDMGKKSISSVPDMCKRLLKDSNIWVRVTAADSLGKISDPRSSVPLRDSYEFSRQFLHQYPDLEDFAKHKEVGDGIELLRESLQSLFKVDPESAREATEKGLMDQNPHVRHFTKRAAEWSGYYKKARCMVSIRT